MMAETSVGQESFHKMLKQLYEKKLSSDSSQKFKEKSWQRFQIEGLPTRSAEVFQYIRLRTLYTHFFEDAQNASIDGADLSPYILPECMQSVLVLMNGRYRPDLSRLANVPKRLIILPLQEAFRTYGGFINNQWNKFLIEETDPFSLLNGALYQDGLFIYAPPKTFLETPLQILNVTCAGETSILTTPRIQGYIGAQSQLNLISTSAHLSGQKSLLASHMEIAIDDDSHVRYTQVAFGLSKQTWCFDAFRASLKRNSTLRTVLAAEGSVSMRHDYRIALQGENAEASLNGVWMLSDNLEAHANILIEHQAPHCRSMQLFKSVLDESSHSSFEGKIFVHQSAQKTEAFQLNNNLLLSDKAKADSKPNLEIFADDVKASHGATFGQLDQEQLFYLKTRGYSEQMAKNTLVYGFCKEVLDLITQPNSLVQEMNQRTKRYISHE